MLTWTVLRACGGDLSIWGVFFLGTGFSEEGRGGQREGVKTLIREGKIKDGGVSFLGYGVGREYCYLLALRDGVSRSDADVFAEALP